MDSAISQLTVSTIIVWVIERLKGASWFPVLTVESTERFKRIIGAIFAGLAAVGVTYSYDPNLGVLTIKGLTLTSIVGFLWAWLQNFIVQQGVYHGVVKKPNGAKP